MQRRNDGFGVITIFGITLAIALVGFVGWRVIDANRNSTHADNQKSSNIGEDATEGLRAAGADAANSDLVVLKADDILQGSTPPSSADSNGTSISVSIVDRRDYKYNGMSGFQIYTEQGKSYEPIDLLVSLDGTDFSDCTIAQKYVPDEDNAAPQVKTLQSVAKQRITAYDGMHEYKVTCGEEGKTTSAGMYFRISDGAPKKCKDFSFTDSPITATSLETLKSGIVGKWEGCVKTPWTPAYYVVMRINADGTYSAVSDEVLDGVAMNAMYYGTEEDSPDKKYAINDFQASNLGTGEIDIAFTSGTNKGTLKNVRLMGDKLSFDFYHRNQYGPIICQLSRN